MYRQFVLDNLDRLPPPEGKDFMFELLDSMDDEFAIEPSDFNDIAATLASLFPQLEGIAFDRPSDDGRAFLTLLPGWGGE